MRHPLVFCTARWKYFDEEGLTKLAHLWSAVFVSLINQYWPARQNIVFCPHILPMAECQQRLVTIHGPKGNYMLTVGHWWVKRMLKLTKITDAVVEMNNKQTKQTKQKKSLISHCKPQNRKPTLAQQMGAISGNALYNLT